MKKIISFLDEFLKISASFTFILILVGYIDLKTYYRFFGVNISGYITPSEILIISIDNTLIVLIYSAVQLLVWLLFFDRLFNYTEKDILAGWKEGERRPKYQDDSDETIRRFAKTKKLIMLFILLWGSLIVVSFIKSIFTYNKIISQISIFLFVNAWIVLCIYIGGLTFTRKLWKLAKKQNRYNPKFLVAFILFIPVLLLSVWLNSHFMANQSRKFRNEHQIEIQLQDNSIVKSNDSVKYIGRTVGYLFFWDYHSGQTTIYPSSQIKQIISSKKY